MKFLRKLPQNILWLVSSGPQKTQRVAAYYLVTSPLQLMPSGQLLRKSMQRTVLAPSTYTFTYTLLQTPMRQPMWLLHFDGQEAFLAQHPLIFLIPYLLSSYPHPGPPAHPVLPISLWQHHLSDFYPGSSTVPSPTHHQVLEGSSLKSVLCFMPTGPLLSCAWMTEQPPCCPGRPHRAARLSLKRTQITARPCLKPSDGFLLHLIFSNFIGV